MPNRLPQRRQDEDDSGGTPGWIVSWTDMVTLLLSFFVMLQSMAVERSDELFQIGRGAFLRAVSGFGIPGLLYGDDPQMPAQEHKKVKHSMEPTEDVRRDRTIDAEAEEIRQLFMELRNQVETETSDYPERPLRVDELPVRFKDGQAELGRDQQESVADYADTLKRNLAGRRIRVYAVGLADDVSAPSERMVVAARRARAVEEVLQSEFSEQTEGGSWQLRSWGAADGGAFSRQAGVTPGSAQMFVVVSEAR